MANSIIDQQRDNADFHLIDQVWPFGWDKPYRNFEQKRIQETEWIFGYNLRPPITNFRIAQVKKLTEAVIETVQLLYGL